MELSDGLSTVFIYLSVIFVLSVCHRQHLALFTHTHRTPSLPLPLRCSLLSVQVKDESQGRGWDGREAVAQLHIHMLSRL